MLNKYSKSDKEVSAFKWVCKICDKSLPTLKEMNKSLSSLKLSNDARFDAIETQVKNVESSIGEKVSNEVGLLKDQIMAEISGEIEQKFDSRFKEMNDRKSREMNLILFNVPVSKDTDPLKRKDSDISFISMLFNTITTGETDSTAEKFAAKNVYRLRSQDSSKIPPIKVLCDSKSQVKKLLSNAYKIKSLHDESLKNIIVSRDQTKEQREVNKTLREELLKKNEGGEQQYTIRNGQIVEKPKKGKGNATASGLTPSE
ncbi:MAG: hypothetical protein ABW168_21190 [Sedimenticola sp.]